MQKRGISAFLSLRGISASLSLRGISALLSLASACINHGCMLDPHPHSKHGHGPVQGCPLPDKLRRGGPLLFRALLSRPPSGTGDAHTQENKGDTDPSASHGPPPPCTTDPKYAAGSAAVGCASGTPELTGPAPLQRQRSGRAPAGRVWPSNSVGGGTAATVVAAAVAAAVQGDVPLQPPPPPDEPAAKQPTVAHNAPDLHDVLVVPSTAPLVQRAIQRGSMELLQLGLVHRASSSDALEPCFVCVEQVASCVFLPCGHGGCCRYGWAHKRRRRIDGL